MSVLPNTDSERKQAEPDTDYLLAAIRSGGLRVSLLSNQLDTIGVGLKRGMITPAVALEWMTRLTPGHFYFLKSVWHHELRLCSVRSRFREC